MHRPRPLRGLATSTLVRAADVVCDGCEAGVRAPEVSERVSLCFVRTGLFERRVGAHAGLGAPGNALVFAPGVEYRVTHPLGRGDRCLSLAPSPALLEDRAPELRESLTELAGLAPLALEPGLELALRRLARALEEANDPELEERALALVGALLARWRAGRGAPALGAARQNRPRRAAEIAAEAEAALLRRLDRRLDLARLAAELELSPWHLSRAFRAATGTTLSARHERLRLAAACERLLDGERDLAGLALALGFCDHAHMTRRFRTVLGLAPSEVRNGVQARPAPRR